MTVPAISNCVIRCLEQTAPSISAHIWRAQPGMRDLVTAEYAFQVFVMRMKISCARRGCFAFQVSNLAPRLRPIKIWGGGLD